MIPRRRIGRKICKGVEECGLASAWSEVLVGEVSMEHEETSSAAMKAVGQAKAGKNFGLTQSLPLR